MTNASSSIDLCDRLHDAMYELLAVHYALLGRPGIELDDRIACGFCSILRRQIEEIEAIAKALHS